MFRKTTTKGFAGGHRFDIIHSIYRTNGDLKMLRHTGIRNMISSMVLPIVPSSGKSYNDFFRWYIQDINRCKEYNLKLYPVIGIPAVKDLDPKILDEALMYLEDFLKAKKIIGIGEIGMGEGSKAEYKTMKRQLQLAHKYDVPVIISAPKRNKVANISIILKELKREKVNRAIINQSDIECIKLIVRDHWGDIKAGLTVGKQDISPKEAVNIYKSLRYTNRICLNSGIGIDASSLFGLCNTIELFEEEFPDEDIQKMCYNNYLDVFPSIDPNITH